MTVIRELNGCYKLANAFSAATTVTSISAGPCAVEMNPASN